MIGVGMLLCALAGCITAGDKVGMHEQDIDMLHHSNRMQAGAARAQIAGDAAVLDPYEQAEMQSYSDIKASIGDLRARIAEQEKQLGDLVRSLGAALSLTIPAGPLGPVLANALSTFVRTTKARAEQAAADVGAIKGDVAALKETVQRQVAGASESAKGLIAGIDAVRAEAAGKIDLAAHKIELRLLPLEKDQGAFKEELARAAHAAGLSQAEVARLQGMPVEQLLAAGGVPAVLGALALFRTLGRSRAQDQVDELYDKVESLKVGVAAMPTGGSAAKAA